MPPKRKKYEPVFSQNPIFHNQKNFWSRKIGFGEKDGPFLGVFVSVWGEETHTKTKFVFS